MNDIRDHVIITFVGGLIPELTLSYIIMKIVDGDWSIFLLTYIAIQLFYLIIWFFRSIVNTVYFRAFSKRQMVKDFYELLIKYRYPIEGYFIYDKADVVRYFEDIAFEPRLKAETRINAGVIYGGFDILRVMGEYQVLFRVRKAALEAVKKYFMEKDARIDPQRIVDPSTIKTAEDLS
jgi:hypothetical protein